MRTARRIVLPVLVIALAVAAGGSARSTAAAPAVGSVSGRVTSSTTSQGLAGSVQIRNVNGTFLEGNLIAGSAPLDASGNYSINLPPGDYQVLTQNTEGYINELWNNVPCSTVCDTSAATTLHVTTGAITGIDFVLDPGGRIAGTVTDSGTGFPLANVIVEFTAGDTFFTRAVTDVNGNYLTEGGTATGTVYARTQNAIGYFNKRYPNFACAPDNCDLNPTGTPISVTNGVTTGGINFALAKGGQITGTVTDSNGAPLANVGVWVFGTCEINLLCSLLDITQTDASGQYSTAGLTPTSPGTSTVVYTKNHLGYVDELYDDVVCLFNTVGNLFCDPVRGTPLVVTSGATTSNINFSLMLGGTVAGALTNAQGGAPLAGTVSVYSVAGTRIQFTTVTGSGQYQTRALPPGTYFVVGGSPGFGGQVYDGVPSAACLPTCGTPVIVVAGATTAGIDFLLSASPPASISGTVTSVPNGSPVAGVAIVLFLPNGQEYSTGATNASGVYTITGLTGGASYYVAANRRVFYPGVTCENCNATASGGTLVAVTAGTTTTNIDIPLQSQFAGTITGSVTDAGTGAPLSGVPVQAFNSASVLIAHVLTNVSGVYTIAGLQDGPYYLRTASTSRRLVNEVWQEIPCTLAGCFPTAGFPVSVTDGGTASNVNFTLASTQGAQIRGKVRSSTGVAISGAQVQLFSSTGRLLRTASSSLDGSYVLSVVPDGTYFLRASGADTGFVDELYDNISCVPACHDVTVGTPVVMTGGTDIVGKDFSLDPGGTVIGNVRDANSLAPIPSAVSVFSSGGALVKTVTATASGFYAVLGLPAGTYYARTQNTLGYKDKVFNNVTFCDPSCDVTTGSPIVVTVGNVTSGIDFDLVAGTEMMLNPTFSNSLIDWSRFATPEWFYLVGYLIDGAFHFYRAPPPPGTSNSAVILQNTGVAVATGEPVLAQFDLANTSDVRKRMSVLVHDADFSDLAVCTYWLPPNSAGRYGMLTHPTEGWTSASISFYAASEDSHGGFYRIDNVTMQAIGSVGISETQCIDAQLLSAGGGAAGPELLVNGDFSTGNTSGWTTLFQITSQVVGGVFEFTRPSPNSDPAGVILQHTGTAAAAGDRFTAHFELGNSSSVRKRVSVLLHDLLFTDLTVCTFWLAPGQALTPYAMQGYATKAWGNATISIYAATAGNEAWMRLDDVSLKKTPSASITGTGCFEPGSSQPAAAIEVSSNASAKPPAAFAGSVSAGTSSPAAVVAEQPDLRLEAATGRVGTPWTMVDLTQTDAGILSFESRFAGDDPIARVEISVDGAPWQTLTSVPVSDDWLNVSVDLSPYAGHVVRVRFVLNAGVVNSSDTKRWQIRKLVYFLGR